MGDDDVRSRLRVIGRPPCRRRGGGESIVATGTVRRRCPSVRMRRLSLECVEGKELGVGKTWCTTTSSSAQTKGRGASSEDRVLSIRTTSKITDARDGKELIQCLERVGLPRPGEIGVMVAQIRWCRLGHVGIALD